MVSWESKFHGNWTKNTTICPKRLNSELESWIPPLTTVSDDVIHPFCIAKGDRPANKLKRLVDQLKEQLPNLQLSDHGLVKANTSGFGITINETSKYGLQLDYQWL